MFGLNPAAIAALDSLGLSRSVGPARVKRADPEAKAKRMAKAFRRAERWARFEASAKDGLRYSRSCARAKMKPAKGDGGARSAWDMNRIVAEHFSTTEMMHRMPNDRRHDRG